MRRRVLPYAAVVLVASVACNTDVSQPSAPEVRPALDVIIVQTGADLAITKEVDRKNMRIGDEVTFTITVTNLGPEAATDVVFGDPMPDPLNEVSFSCSGGTQAGGTFCAVSNLAVGATASATLVATPISNPARTERRFTNTAFIESSGVTDPNTSNNTATLKLHIIGPAK